MVSPGKSDATNNILASDTVLQTRYIVNSIITGENGARIYKGKDLETDKEVVIKELAPEEIQNDSERENYIKQFDLEVRFFSDLFHSSLPRLLATFEFEGKKYMIMSYIKGEKLDAFIEKKESFLYEEDVIKLGAQLCDVIQYLHKRDSELVKFAGVCPQNLIITEKGNLKLVNFGQYGLYNTFSQSASRTGKKFYSPIEQYTARPDRNSDIYSLGATLYFLATGKPPVDAFDRALHNIVLPPCWHFNPSLSPGLELVIFKAMELDKKDRFDSILSMKKALETSDAEVEASEEKESPKSKEEKKGKNGKSKTFFGGLLGFLTRSL